MQGNDDNIVKVGRAWIYVSEIMMEEIKPTRSISNSDGLKYSVVISMFLQYKISAVFILFLFSCVESIFEKSG